MRKLLLTTLVCGLVSAARPAPARADVGLGVFLIDPTGVDLKIGLGDRSALDLLLGVNTIRDGRFNYGHVTYLVTPMIAQGRSVLVPIRLGVGAALFGRSDDLRFAIRAPFEVALRLRTAPIEFYGELALAVVLFTPNDDLRLDFQGGVGFRVYF
jgi:hypothetical protein